MSKEENVKKLSDLLSERLNSRGKTYEHDGYGRNKVYVDYNIFTPETLEAFLNLSLSEFNQTPYFSFYTFEDDKFVEVFSEILVEGATLYALASHALLEKGREYSVTDAGISMVPPSVADLMNKQHATLIGHHFQKLKHIKSSISDFQP